MSEQDTKKKKFPINAPTTSFAMKANLVQREPEFQKRWDRMGLYDRIRAMPHPRGPFIFHDGPPYANGDIHLGHLLNKVLKDLVVRTKLMAGFDCPFIPGWDCHGLPIEHRVLKELGDAANGMDAMKIRYKCRDYAAKYAKLQAKQMQRLGTLADYEHPYITMDPAYEAGVLEVFADMVQRGLVYRALKPVHWSIANRTALADAELEYYDREDTSVYVKFQIENASNLPGDMNPQGLLQGLPIYLLIWTTTPWTLPANMSVAVAPDADYELFRCEDSSGRSFGVIVATGGAKKLLEENCAKVECIGKTRGSSLARHDIRYQHPFISRTCPVVRADYVTLEDGTGLVHTAPGHGVEDFETGKKYFLRFVGKIGDSDVEKTERAAGKPLLPARGIFHTYCPVKEDGTFDDTAPDWLRGVDVWEANDLVVNKLRESGHLFHSDKFTHSYPHDWRSKTPVIFRATEQWFVGVDIEFRISKTLGHASSLRYLALMRSSSHDEQVQLAKATGRATQEGIHFIPDWGRNRMRGMLENMPDWCISRQRAWGLPIPAFFPPASMEAATVIFGLKPLLTSASVRAVAKVIAKHGSDAWFKMTPAELLAEYDVNSDPDAPQWAKSEIGNRQSATEGPRREITKGRDIFDVWFESGSSWNPVLRERGGDFPADLYLEGSDQHRGWFQKALLTALGSQGQPPFRELLTHGFMVDAHGNKMSKSEGNAIEVEELMKQHGADVARWWVATLNYANDVKVDWEFFKHAGEQYRKVRNTIRFLLGNIGGKPRDGHPWAFGEKDRYSIDAWAHAELSKLIASVRADYDAYNFRGASEHIFNFCNDTLSAVYLAAVKDRMYCDAVDSDRRLRTQFVMREIADALIRLVAPILVHTADEAWLSLHEESMDSDRTVHTQSLPDAHDVLAVDGWGVVMALRERAMKKLEDERTRQGIDNPLDAGVTMALPADPRKQLEPFAAELADLHGVSRFELKPGDTESIEIVDLRNEPRCQRSWKRDGTVKQYTDGEGDVVWLSARDAKVLGLA